MTLGEKIRRLRVLRKLTQKELGIRSGFSATTADVRIRQYESNKMAPKADKLEAIRNALDVDISALSDVNVKDAGDVMQILFQLEDMGMDVSISDGKVHLLIDESNANMDLLVSYLNIWDERKKVSQTDDNLSDDTFYQLWKANLPREAATLWARQIDTLNHVYQKDIAALQRKKAPVQRSTELVSLLRSMIEKGMTVDCLNYPSDISEHALGIEFRFNEVINAEPDIHLLFVEFLADLNSLEHYGLPISRIIRIRSGISYILYVLPLVTLIAPIQAPVQKLHEHLAKNARDPEHQRFDRTFYMEFENNINTNYVNLEEDIHFYYGTENQHLE